MFIKDLGAAIRKERSGRRWTQQRLATAAGLSRNTLNRLENGQFPDLGVTKAEAVLEKLGMRLAIVPAGAEPKQQDFVGMACIAASVSYREMLTPDELVRALLSGRVAANREAHFITLLEEAPSPLLKGLIRQVGQWTKAGKLERNLMKIADALGVTPRSDVWQTRA